MINCISGPLRPLLNLEKVNMRMNLIIQQDISSLGRYQFIEDQKVVIVSILSSVECKLRVKHIGHMHCKMAMVLPRCILYILIQVVHCKYYLVEHRVHSLPRCTICFFASWNFNRKRFSVRVWVSILNLQNIPKLLKIWTKPLRHLFPNLLRI